MKLSPYQRLFLELGEHEHKKGKNDMSAVLRFIMAGIYASFFCVAMVTIYDYLGIREVLDPQADGWMYTALNQGFPFMFGVVCAMPLFYVIDQDRGASHH